MTGVISIESNIFQFIIIILIAGCIGFAISYYYTIKVYSLVESREKKKSTAKQGKGYTIFYIILFLLIMYIISK